MQVVLWQRNKLLNTAVLVESVRKEQGSNVKTAALTPGVNSTDSHRGT